MKKDKMIMLVSMFLNLVVASVKLICGIVFDFSSLIADSLHSLSDFVTDLLSMVASKVGDKRANKRHPFGYGMIENISNLFIGVILVLLALFILVRGFTTEASEVDSIIFIVLIVSLLLKLFIVCMLYFGGKKLKNNSLLVSAKESFVDMIATVIVLIVSVLLLFKERVYIFKYADIVGSILISIIIFKVAFDIIKVNVNYLLGTNEENEEISKGINDIIDDFKTVKDSEFKLLKIGDYYTLYLTIELDDSITLRRIMILETKIKKKIKNSIKDIKYIQIEIKEFR